MWNELDMPSVEDPLDDWDIPDHDAEWAEMWREVTFYSYDVWRDYMRAHGLNGLLQLTVSIEPAIWDSEAA